MQLSSFYNYYKVGRFIFALTFIITFEFGVSILKMPLLLVILIIYASFAFLKLFSVQSKFLFIELLIDIIVISSALYMNIATHSFLTLFYLAPIYLASVMIKSSLQFLIPAFAGLLYIIIFLFKGNLLSEVNIINIILHCLAFFLISFAGNAMKDKLYRQEAYIKKLEEERIKAESYKRLYRVSADLIHEIRNPLTTISASIQFLKEGKNNPELLEMLYTETKRLTNLANDFLLFSRPKDAPREDLNVAEIIKSLVNNFSTNDKRLIADVENDASVLGNRTFFEVALSNVIKNALEAAETLVILTMKKDKNKVVINVEDDGSGIQEGAEERIFEPFFTTKKSGTGLGLAITNRIIDSMGGIITFDKSEIGGAKFSITLPLKDN